MGEDRIEEGMAALGVLAEPLRRALYRYVAASPHEVSRSEAAEAVGVPRGLAAFHLDRLVDAGLLEVTYRRLGERRGPGAGRPAKLYRRAPGEHEVSVPPREYGTLARLLAEAVEAAGAGLTLQERARRYGEAAGRRARAAGAGDATALLGTLRALGYEPYLDRPGTPGPGAPEGREAVVRLRNCPFHRLAREFPPLVCGMNLALVEGLLAGLGAGGSTARKEPHPDRCCVAVRVPQGAPEGSG